MKLFPYIMLITICAIIVPCLVTFCMNGRQANPNPETPGAAGRIWRDDVRTEKDRSFAEYRGMNQEERHEP